MGCWPGGRSQEGRPAADSRARRPRGCVESPEDRGHASQLRQQRLQPQPLSTPRQTGRVLPFRPLPSWFSGAEGRGPGFLGLCPGTLRGQEAAGGRGTLLDSRAAGELCISGGDPHPSAPPAGGCSPRPLMVPIAFTSPGVPSQEAF